MERPVIHILLVEDSPSDALLLEMGLEGSPMAQFALTHVDCLGAALVQLQRQSFDVVVLDIGLPDSAGLGGLQKIRTVAHSVPILLLTGLKDEEAALTALQYGAQDYLVKGHADDQAIARAIRYAIERKRGEELELAKEAAEAANKAKDHFLAILSHELRTPLAPVVAALAMVRQRSDLDEALRETLDMVQRNVELEARLIDDLLDLTRIARGKIELTRSTVPLCTVIHRAIEVCLPDLEARELQFTVDWGDRPYWVEADIARLQQAFWNLLRNAIKFTPHGGRVGLCCRRSEGSVLVEVSDSGIGIEPAAIPRLFNAFEQAERSITRQFGGLGLGLAISRALVELHGGSIEAQSDGKGHGATFRIRLPLVVPAAEPQGPLVPPARVTVRPLRILLVEDHGDTAKVMRRVLAAEGHAVEVAGDVATALQVAAAQPFDLLLSDLGLPDQSGLELMRELRLRGQVLPGIALSGFGQEKDLEASREVGFATHLTKPISPERLAQAIAAVAGAGER